MAPIDGLWKMNLRIKNSSQLVSDVITAKALKLGNYNSFEGVLYCRPHFDQLFKQTGSLDKSFEGTPKIVKPQKLIDTEKPQVAKVTSMFGGTRRKCFGCKNTVYPTEKVSVNGTPYHKSCFSNVAMGGCVISPSNYIAHEGRHCKTTISNLSRRKATYKLGG
ncbi:LIM domain-containing protein wlim1 [Datura stramonium]|uniref:LIM domain-containing protein wlim1 n=1 Tax=Datura stramonium TaxID=4076 RepID=A0ABS8SHY3_DATST|nr:LIM domain-containing protein wlim1 [Datura stramonium]